MAAQGSRVAAALTLPLVLDPFHSYSSSSPILFPFQGNVKPLRVNPSPYPSINLCYHKAKRGSHLMFRIPRRLLPKKFLEVLDFWFDNLGPQLGSQKKEKRKGRGHAAGRRDSCRF
ncbi:50S ribosomal protein L15, chloroplastic-like [Salvia divinorum]|uniref:50S ribosomal protein L15, chloroplastic-like n=1 Tax=Salvia divinorum TaxID=28513 RepID=A0ABD1IIZ7_SALDI